MSSFRTSIQVQRRGDASTGGVRPGEEGAGKVDG